MKNKLYIPAAETKSFWKIDAPIEAFLFSAMMFSGMLLLVLLNT